MRQNNELPLAIPEPSTEDIAPDVASAETLLRRHTSRSRLCSHQQSAGRTQAARVQRGLDERTGRWPRSSSV